MIFVLLSVIVLVSAVAAITLRNLVHCALALTVTFAGLAAVYLQLEAQFVGFAQLLVYVGAVAILLVFAILITRGREPAASSRFASGWLGGLGVAVVVCGVLSAMILSSGAVKASPSAAPQATVGQIGDELMTRYVLPLEVVGLLLTAALLGAVIIALQERR